MNMHASTPAAAPALTKSACKWPIGDPGQPDFRFCGERAEIGQPYCHDHCVISYPGYAKRFEAP